MSSKFDTSTPSVFLKSILEGYQYFSSELGEENPLAVNYTLGDSPMVVVTGENATGKSFFRRFVTGALSMARPEIKTIHLSQEGRSSSGIASAIVYGDESYRSTGANSSNVIDGAFKTARGRKEAHAIVFDEPDIGLSDNYAAGAGVAIRSFCEEKPPLTFLVMVMSHNRHLIRELAAGNPSHVHFGSIEPVLLADWLEWKPTPKPPSELPARAHATFQAIESIIKGK